MRKIIDSYKRFDSLPDYHAPEFRSNASEIHVVLWNLNYGNDDEMNEKEFLKEDNKFRKEFLKAQRMIYKMISSNSGITIRYSGARSASNSSLKRSKRCSLTYKK